MDLKSIYLKFRDDYVSNKKNSKLELLNEMIDLKRELTEEQEFYISKLEDSIEKLYLINISFKNESNNSL